MLTLFEFGWWGGALCLTHFVAERHVDDITRSFGSRAGWLAGRTRVNKPCVLSLSWGLRSCFQPSCLSVVSLTRRRHRNTPACCMNMLRLDIEPGGGKWNQSFNIYLQKVWSQTVKSATSISWQDVKVIWFRFTAAGVWLNVGWLIILD